MARSSGMFSTDVWDRDGGRDVLGERTCVMLLNFWILSGLGMTPLTFVGVFITDAESAPLSLVGYACIVIPFGLMLGPVVATYSAATVYKAVGVTFLVSGSLGAVGTVFPNLLRGYGKYLFAGLAPLLFGQIFALVADMFGLPVGGAMTALDWVGAALFSAYVAYDYGRAMTVTRTLDNSVDCAVAIYLDIPNLFLRILSILGKKD